MSRLHAEEPYNRREPIPAELVPRRRCAEAPPPELIRGVEQFNEGAYFECHGTLESLWNAEPKPMRTLYKGILQIGVGCYHLLNGNYRGAVMKLRTGAEYLEPFAPSCQQVDVEHLVASARLLRDRIEAAGPDHLGEVDLNLLPVIRYVRE